MQHSRVKLLILLTQKNGKTNGPGTIHNEIREVIAVKETVGLHLIKSVFKTKYTLRIRR